MNYNDKNSHLCNCSYFLQNSNKYLALEWEASKEYINVKIPILIITRASNFRTLNNSWYLRNFHIMTAYYDLIIPAYYPYYDDIISILALIFDHGTGCPLRAIQWKD